MSDMTRSDPVPTPRIVADRAVRFGKPVVRGTRVAVDEIVGLLASGASKDEVAVEFGVALEDIHAALEYAARSVANERRYAE